MKKIFLVVICAFIFFLGGSSCYSYPKTEINASRRKKENTYNYAAINDDIDNEVFELFVKLHKNYKKNNNEVVFSYEKFTDPFALSFLFDFWVYSGDNIVRKIKRTYNYAASDGKSIILNDIILIDVYWPLLQNEMKKRGININTNDLKFFKYIVNKDEIVFYYPLDYEANYLTVTLANNGVTYQDTADTEVNGERRAALTFDDGPSSATKDLVDLLNKYQIKATFFLLGERVKYYPDEVGYIYQSGHEIGNHSYSHPDFSKITLSEAEKEIADTQEAVYKLISSYPKLFRFPYGNYNISALNMIDLPVVLWDCDSEDWRYRNSQIVYNNVLSSLSAQTVILFHDFAGYHKTAIEAVINYLDSQGYRFVTVSEMFAFHSEENVVFGKIYY
ncbi:MAG: polysaccharide deacetylase family protein [Bacilli bacterium]|nr:polysaccharide deacetylase family protein [Bacilli bacterium]MDD4388568.1 polysaccharide deacetylase family protein [Bacilli bacterium]